MSSSESPAQLLARIRPRLSSERARFASAQHGAHSGHGAHDARARELLTRHDARLMLPPPARTRFRGFESFVEPLCEAFEHDLEELEPAQVSEALTQDLAQAWAALAERCADEAVLHPASPMLGDPYGGWETRARWAAGTNPMGRALLWRVVQRLYAGLTPAQGAPLRHKAQAPQASEDPDTKWRQVREHWFRDAILGILDTERWGPELLPLALLPGDEGARWRRCLAELAARNTEDRFGQALHPAGFTTWGAPLVAEALRDGTWAKALATSGRTAPEVLASPLLPLPMSFKSGADWSPEPISAASFLLSRAESLRQRGDDRWVALMARAASLGSAQDPYAGPSGTRQDSPCGPGCQPAALPLVGRAPGNGSSKLPATRDARLAPPLAPLSSASSGRCEAPGHDEASTHAALGVLLSEAVSAATAPALQARAFDDALQGRQSALLRRMVQQGWISPEDFKAALAGAPVSQGLSGGLLASLLMRGDQDARAQGGAARAQWWWRWLTDVPDTSPFWSAAGELAGDLGAFSALLAAHPPAGQPRPSPETLRARLEAALKPA